MNSTTPETRLHRRLTPFEALLLTLSCLSPVFSVYGPGAQVLRQSGTGAAALFALGIGVAAVWGMVYAELGSAYPYAGGDYVGVGTVLGPAAGFACLALWAVIILPMDAYLAKLVATYATEVLPGSVPGLWIYGALLAALAVALLAVRASALVTGIFLSIEFAAVLALVIAGFLHPAASAWTAIAHPRLPVAGRWAPVGAAALALGAVNAAFATAGGNQAIAFGEELIDPHRNMGRVLLAACLLGALAIALPVIAVVVGAAGDPAVFASAAPFSAYISSVAGPWAGIALSAAVALAVFNALIAQIMFGARLWYSFARDRVFPAPISAALAKVHGRSGVPRIATLTVGVLSGACCVLSQRVLLVFLSGLVVYALALVSAAVLVGRLKGLTGGADRWRSPLFPLAPLLGLALACAFAGADWADASIGRPSLFALGAVLGAALLWYRCVLSRRPGGWAPQVTAAPHTEPDPAQGAPIRAGGWTDS
ncbi:MAG: APC family permease [Steroidobacteraceae bacterium]